MYANLTRAVRRMRELYVSSLTTALATHILQAGCNWEVAFANARGPLSKLCFECEEASDGAAPADSQCCLAYDVEVDPRSGIERTLKRELDGRFCHRQLWASCEHAVSPTCCDLDTGAQVEFAGDWHAAHANCSGTGNALFFGSDDESRQWQHRGSLCGVHHASSGEWTPVNLWHAFVGAEQAVFGQVLLDVIDELAPGLHRLPAPRRDAMLRAMPSKVMGTPKLRRHLRSQLVRRLRQQLTISPAAVDPAEDEDEDAATEEQMEAALSEMGASDESGPPSMTLKTCGPAFVQRRTRALVEGFYGGRGTLLSRPDVRALLPSDLVLAAGLGPASPSALKAPTNAFDQTIVPTVVFFMVYFLALSHSPNPLIPNLPAPEMSRSAQLVGALCMIFLSMISFLSGRTTPTSCENSPGSAGCEVIQDDVSFSGPFIGQALEGYASDGGRKHASYDEAKTVCIKDPGCSGITQEPVSGNAFTTRAGAQLSQSTSGETSWKKPGQGLLGLPQLELLNLASRTNSLLPDPPAPAPRTTASDAAILRSLGV